MHHARPLTRYTTLLSLALAPFSLSLRSSLPSRAAEAESKLRRFPPLTADRSWLVPVACVESVVWRSLTGEDSVRGGCGVHVPPVFRESVEPNKACDQLDFNENRTRLNSTRSH